MSLDIQRDGGTLEDVQVVHLVIAVLRVPCLSPEIKRVDDDEEEEEEEVEKVGASGLER